MTIDQDLHDATVQRFLDILNAAERAPAGMEILAVTLDDAAMLVHKNTVYGNSALDPSRVLSKASVRDGVLMRADDKISRIVRGEDAGEDPWTDLRGYLILVEIDYRRQNAETDGGAL